MLTSWGKRPTPQLAIEPEQPTGSITRGGGSVLTNLLGVFNDAPDGIGCYCIAIDITDSKLGKPLDDDESGGVPSRGRGDDVHGDLYAVLRRPSVVGRQSHAIRPQRGIIPDAQGKRITG